MEEIWKVYDVTPAGKPFKCGKRTYTTWEVSNCGNIRKKSGKTGFYKSVNLSKSGGNPNKRYLCVPKNNEKYLHRIVAKTFVPNPNPEKYTQVDHIDENIYNNVWTNLRWVTPNFNKTRKKRNCPHCDRLIIGYRPYDSHINACKKK